MNRLKPMPVFQFHPLVQLLNALPSLLTQRRQQLRFFLIKMKGFRQGLPKPFSILYDLLNLNSLEWWEMIPLGFYLKKEQTVSAF